MAKACPVQRGFHGWQVEGGVYSDVQLFPQIPHVTLAQAALPGFQVWLCPCPTSWEGEMQGT